MNDAATRVVTDRYTHTHTHNPLAHARRGAKCYTCMCTHARMSTWSSTRMCNHARMRRLVWSGDGTYVDATMAAKYARAHS